MLAALEGADSVAVALGAAERAKQLVAHEFGVHSRSVVDNLDHGLAVAADETQPDRAGRTGRLERIVDEMGEDHVQALLVGGHHDGPAETVTDQPAGTLRLPVDDALQIAIEVDRVAARTLVLVLVQPDQQLLHLFDRFVNRFQHIFLKGRVGFVLLRVVKHERKLAREVLDIVNDKCKPTVKSVELLGLDQRARRGVFFQVARALAPGGLEEVVVLPVQLPGRARPAENEYPRQAVMVHERDQQPRSRDLVDPIGNSQGLVPIRAAAMVDHVDDPLALLQKAREIRFRPQDPAARPAVPRRQQIEAVVVLAPPDGAFGAVDDCGQSLDDPMRQAARRPR